MKIRCPQCQTQYPNIPEKFRNRKVVCKKCQFRFKADDCFAMDMPQETRLADPQKPAKASGVPQQTRMAEPGRLKPPEKSNTRTLSTLARVLGMGSEYLLKDSLTTRQQVSDWQKGDVILDLYEVKALLGEGQFGKVYRVRHRNWNLDLAVKTPQEKALRLGADNIIKEAETWVNLALHPNIVNCYYVRTIDGIPRIFSEYVDAGDLKQQINNKHLYQGDQKQILNRILDIAIQFAWGLYFAHQQDLIHQDIKPANIMLGTNGVVKITDFGLAKNNNAEGVTGRNTKNTTAMGMTPAYASPEQLAGKTLTHRTDIWSWAVCVLEMVLGYCSWEAGAAVPGVLAAYLNQELDNEPILKSMPAELEQIISQCFEEQDALRPDNMLVLAQELISVYRHQNGTAYPRIPPLLGSETASSYNNQAISLVDLGRTAEASQLWQKALGIEPQHFESIYNLSLLQWQEKGLEENVLFERLLSLFNKIKPNKTHEQALARLYLHFGQFNKAIRQLNQGQIKFSSLPDKPDRDNNPELGLALCARYRLVKDPLRWQYITRCLLSSVAGKINDPYAITAYTLALQKSGAKKQASEFYKMIQDSGVIPLPFKQAIRLFLPAYEVLYRRSGKNISCSVFAKNNENLIYTQANQIVLMSLKTGKTLKVLQGHTVKISALYYAPNYELIISGSQQGNIRVWSESTGQPINIWFAHQSAIQALELSPCGRYLVSAAQEEKLYLWDVNNGSQIQSFYGEGHDGVINAISFSPCGKKLLSAGADKVLRVWDIASGRTELILRGHEHEVAQAIWINERTLLSSGKDRTIRIWSLDKRASEQHQSGHHKQEQPEQKQQTLQSIRVLKGHKGSVDSIVAARERFYAVSGGSDGRVQYWDLVTGKSFVLHRFEDPVVDLSLDNSEQFVLVVSRKGVAILEVNNPYRYQARFVFSYPESALEVDKLQADYLKRVQKSELKQQQHNYIAASRELEQARNLPGYAQDKKAYNHWALLYLKLPRLSLKDVWQGKEEQKYFCRINSLCTGLQTAQFFLANREGGISCWQTDSFITREIINNNKPVSRIKLSGDKNSLLFASEQDLQLIDINSGEYLSSFHYHNADINCFDTTPDARFVISSDTQGGCYLWRLLTGEIINDFSDNKIIVSHLVITPDGQKFIYAAINNNYLSIKNIQTGHIVSKLEGHDQAVTSLDISLDGRYLISGSADTTLRLWSLDSNQPKCLQVYSGHNKRINQLVMDKQAKIVVSISADQSLKIWDLEKGSCLYTFTIVDADFSALAISSDGKYIVAGRTDGVVMSWCLDWILDQSVHYDWDTMADIYIHNYLISRKVNDPVKETEKIIALLDQAGFGFLNKADIVLRLKQQYESILQQKKLTGSVIASAAQLSSKKIRPENKRLLPLVAVVALFAILMFVFMPGDSDNNLAQTETAQTETNAERIILDSSEQKTVNKLLDIASRLAALNSNPLIVNKHLNVNTLIVPDNLKKLRSWLQLEPAQLVDAWGQPFKFSAITTGAFKSRIMFRSSGQDKQYKTDDDLLLNGYPYQGSLAVRKDNKIILRLSDLAQTMTQVMTEVSDKSAAINANENRLSEAPGDDEFSDNELSEKVISIEEEISTDEDIDTDEEQQIGVEVKYQQGRLTAIQE